MIRAAQALAAPHEPAATPAAGPDGRKPFATLMAGALKGTQRSASGTRAARATQSTQANAAATGSAAAAGTSAGTRPDSTSPATREPGKPDTDAHDAHRDAGTDTAAAPPDTAPATNPATNPAAGLSAAAAVDAATGTTTAIPDGDSSGNPLPASGKPLPPVVADATHHATGSDAASTGVTSGGTAMLAEVADAQAMARTIGQRTDAAATATPAGDPARSGIPAATTGNDPSTLPGTPLTPASTPTSAPVPTPAARTEAGFAAGPIARPPVGTDSTASELISATTGNRAVTSATPATADGTTAALLVGGLRRDTDSASTTTATDASGRLVAAFAAGHAGIVGTDAGSTMNPGANPGSPGNGGATGSTPVPSALQSSLQPLGSAGAFASGLADRLLAMGGPGIQSARLKLHPEHLGALQVDIRITDGSAEVWFGAASGQARHAIQASLPQLRQLFADQGIDLARTHVGTGNVGSGASSLGQGMAHGHGYGQGYSQNYDPYSGGNAARDSYRWSPGLNRLTSHSADALPALAARAGMGSRGAGPGQVDVRV